MDNNVSEEADSPRDMVLPSRPSLSKVLQIVVKGIVKICFWYPLVIIATLVLVCYAGLIFIVCSVFDR